MTNLRAAMWCWIAATVAQGVGVSLLTFAHLDPPTWDLFALFAACMVMAAGLACCASCWEARL